MDRLSRDLLAAAQARGERVPDETDAAMAGLWLASQDPDGPPGVSRYLLALWRERVDLHEAYPGLFLDPAQRNEYLRWALAFGEAETGAPSEVFAFPTPVAPQSALSPLVAGVTVVGFFRAVLGIGAAARRLADLVELAGEPVHRRDYDHTSSPRIVHFADTDRFGDAAPPHDIEILVANGPQTPRLVKAIGASRAEAAPYRIGLWFWELDILPEAHRMGLEYLDEVWVSSEFVGDAVRAAAREGFPVHTVPLGTDVADVSAADIDRVRDRLGIRPSRHTIGFAFDHRSRLARKNPLGLVEAYRRAVLRPDSDRVQLVVKTIGAQDFPEQHRRLREATGGRGDITIVDLVLGDADQQAFLAGLDVYVSLHRSEGYGLPLLDAMARRVATIATGYSGNLAFMNPDTSILVPYDLVSARTAAEADDFYSEVPGASWAEPTPDAAVSAIRQVLDELDTGSAELGSRLDHARETARPLVDGTLGAAWVAARLAEIRMARV